MDVVTGAMESLLPKLGELLVGEYNLQKGVKKDVESLEREMKSMHAALTKVAKVPRDQLDQQVKIWADEIRELSYDAEDVVDKFLVSVEGSNPTVNSNKLKGLMEKITSLFTKGKTRHLIANAIKDIKDRAQEVADLRDRCKVDDAVANAASINNTIDPRILALYKDQKDLVGIEDARDQLTKRLTHGEGDASNQPLQIVSIVGPGGLGKTTLAKAVYDSLQTQFNCKAFVPVGRNPNVSKVLKDILLELELGKSMSDIATLDERQLINKLRDLLQDKRYFIIIDDIWDLKAWGIIKCALLDNNRGSRVITTTRILEVAANTGNVYKLEPLSPDLSEELFYTRLFGGKDKCPYGQPSEVSNKILQKCGGVPLAIIAIASLLHHKPMEDWSKVYTSISSAFGDNTDIDNMRRILLFSYEDLPYHLRPCLLHLSIYPEDTLIMKETLIWMWVAEGFVSEKPGFGFFEIGERYFNDLVNRSMILPVEHEEGMGTFPRGKKKGIYACRVHDMVLDIICLLSKEQNFITILDGNGNYSSSKSNARRLAIQTRGEEQYNHLGNTSMPKLRSCYANKCPRSMMPPLSCFEVLRVLDLKNCISIENCHLEHLENLHQLRYLSLENTYISELPKDIGNLKFLETLDLRNCKIKGLPQSTSSLRKLKRLRVDSDPPSAAKWQDVGTITVPNWIGNLASLEELSLKISGEFSTFVEELGKLTELRVLDCHLRGRLDGCSKKTLVDSVCKLEKIQILRLKGLYGWSKSEADNWEGYKPPRQLRELYISSKFSSLPAWINSSLLPNLSELKMYVHPMKERDVVNLGGLPELLKMKHIWIPAGMEFPDGAFPKLRRCGIDAPFRFLPGSMHSLEGITFGIERLLTEKDASIDFDFIGTLGNLPSLRWVDMDRGDARVSDVKKMEAAVRQGINTLPNRPTLCLQMCGKYMMMKNTEDERARPQYAELEVIVEDEEDDEVTSQQTEPEFNDDFDNHVGEEPEDPEERNQDQCHDAEASDSRKADQQLNGERKSKRRRLQQQRSALSGDNSCA